MVLLGVGAAAAAVPVLHCSVVAALGLADRAVLVGQQLAIAGTVALAVAQVHLPVCGCRHQHRQWHAEHDRALAVQYILPNFIANYIVTPPH